MGAVFTPTNGDGFALEELALTARVQALLDCGTGADLVVNGGRKMRGFSMLERLDRGGQRLWLAMAACLLWAGAEAKAVDTTQTVNLDPGWNSVWLNVEPRYDTGDDDGLRKTVEDVFTDAAITVVATPEKPIGSAEFVTDATKFVFNRERWYVWRRSSALNVNSLSRVTGYRGYLIFVSGGDPVSLTITGEARFSLPRWLPDSYHLVGFNLHGNNGAVTFDTFFANVAAKHAVSRIFRLQPDGNWVGVSGNDTMTANVAYQVYCNGASDFIGPARIALPATGNRPGAIDFGSGPTDVVLPDPQGQPDDTISVNLRELTLTDITGSAQTVTLTKVEPPTTGVEPGDAALSDDLRVYEVVPDTEALKYTIGGNGQIVSAPFALAAGASTTVSLGAHRAWTTGVRTREYLYRIDFAHHGYWLPISAENPDVPVSDGSADSAYKGLWVGQAVLDGVSSVTEAGAPVQPTTSRAPMRVIVHVAANGTPSLLTHVMLMRTKTADDDADPPEDVLVINEEKISYFEGIEERGGKKVGRRIETVSYDMPRDFTPATQTTLAAEVAAALGSSTEAKNIIYINSLQARTPNLTEAYYRSWQLEGGLGPDAVLRTATARSGNAGPLLLDPFHRSNPFRHAYHPRHGTGAAITRALTITFDEEQEAGSLVGTYSETVSGLIGGDLIARGRIRLQRISEQGVLQ